MVLELTTVTLVPGMSGWPDLASLTAAAVRKLVPARLVMWTVPVLTPLAGVMPVTLGAVVMAQEATRA